MIKALDYSGPQLGVWYDPTDREASAYAKDIIRSLSIMLPKVPTREGKVVANEIGLRVEAPLEYADFASQVAKALSGIVQVPVMVRGSIQSDPVVVVVSTKPKL